MNKLVRRTAAILLAAVFPALIAAQPAQALSYSYMAGHPVQVLNSDGELAGCTGSWTINGSSGSFIMTAGHCGDWAGLAVSGTQARFGSYAFEKDGAAGNGLGDSGLIRYDAGVTPYQIIVDPVSGRSPGDGRVTGVMPTSEQTVGTLVGKMGVTSGWTEGTITQTFDWAGVTAVCGTWKVLPGDSGGPVWRNDGNGLRAVGMTVGYLTRGGVQVAGCYIPIETLLTQWGAKMNVFPRTATASAGTSTLMAPQTSTKLPPLVTPAQGYTMVAK